MFYYFLNLESSNTQNKNNEHSNQKDQNVQINYCAIGPILALELLLIQLLFSMYIGMAFEEVYVREPYAAQFVCMLYPIGIGIIKISQYSLIKGYKVDTLYRFVSLGLAAMPYKFIYLNIDLPIVVGFVILVKFIYKTAAYFVLYLPWIHKIWSKWVKKTKKSGSPNNPKRAKIESTTFVTGKTAKRSLNQTPVQKFTFGPTKMAKIDLSNLPRLDQEEEEIGESFAELNNQDLIKDLELAQPDDLKVGYLRKSQATILLQLLITMQQIFLIWI